MGVAPEAPQILALAQSDPETAAAQGRSLAEAAAARDDHATAAIASRAEGLARINLRDPPGALEALERARDHAVRSGDPEVHAGVLTTLSVAYLYLGRSAEAVSTIEEAIAMSSGLAKARAEGQRAGILVRLGHLDRALAGFGDAIATVTAAGDLAWRGHFLTNRAIAHGFNGDIDASLADFQGALDAYEQASDRESVAAGIRNLGFAASLAGDIPGALRRFDEAEELFRELRIPPGTLPNDRCRVLLQAGLAREALNVAQRTREELTRTGMLADRPEVALTVARAALQAGDTALATDTASEAADEFAAQARSGWEEGARQLELEARFRAGTIDRAVLDQALRLTGRLEEEGHRVSAQAGHLLAAQIALALGDTATAETQLESATWSRTRGTVDLRISHHLTSAQVRNARGDSRGAAAAVAAGLRTADRYRAALGAIDARASLSGHTVELAALGLELALASGRPRRVLRWMEEGRAAALRYPPVRPPDDGALRRNLAELRRISFDAATAERSGSDSDTLRHRQAALERDIRRRHLRTSAVHTASHRVNVEDAIRGLRGRLLLTWAPHRKATAVITATDRRASLSLEGLTASPHEAASLLSSVRRVVTGRGTERSLAAAEDSVRDGVAALRSRFDARVGGSTDGLVLVPPASLQAVPWSAVIPDPQLVVAPSVRVWYRSDSMRRQRGGVVAVAGPDLDQADREAAAIGRLHSEATVLPSKRSEADRVLAALEGTAVAHFACHGTINAENPQFSALHLADGPLNLYDLQLIDDPPHTVVLSACDLGSSSKRAGEEVIGFTAVLLAMGVATVIASVAPVPDSAATRRLMVGLHERLAAGVRPARALLEARQSLNPKTFREKLAAECFTCFGAG